MRKFTLDCPSSSFQGAGRPEDFYPFGAHFHQEPSQTQCSSSVATRFSRKKIKGAAFFQNLATSGKVVELADPINRGDEEICWSAVDRLTNEIEAMPVDKRSFIKKNHIGKTETFDGKTIGILKEVRVGTW